MVKNDWVEGVLQFFIERSGKASLRVTFEQRWTETEGEILDDNGGKGSPDTGNKYQGPERVPGMLNSWEEGQDDKLSSEKAVDQVREAWAHYVVLGIML